MRITWKKLRKYFHKVEVRNSSMNQRDSEDQFTLNQNFRNECDILTYFMGLDHGWVACDLTQIPDIDNPVDVGRKHRIRVANFPPK